jgi:hypothetical protein
MPLKTNLGKYTCTACGKRVVKAGVAVRPEAIEQCHNHNGTVWMIIDNFDQDVFPVCAACITALWKGKKKAKDHNVA